MPPPELQEEVMSQSLASYGASEEERKSDSMSNRSHKKGQKSSKYEEESKSYYPRNDSPCIFLFCPELYSTKSSQSAIRANYERVIQ